MSKTLPPPPLVPKPEQDSTFDQFLKELESEIQLDKYKALWAKYGRFLTFLIGVLLLGLIFFGFWQRYQTEQKEEIAQQFQQAQALLSQGKKQEALSQMEFICQRTHKNYAILAQFVKAHLLAEEDFAKNVQTVKGLYKDILARPCPGYFKEIAAVSFVETVLLENENGPDEKTAQDLLALLETHRKNSDIGIALFMLEWEGYILFKIGKFDEARQKFDTITRQAKAPESMKKRIALMIQAIQDSH
jgi:hypothetical protein